MSSISLRAYHRQIEEWIDQGLYDQAIIHCRHILNVYSKCLDTYRLLGKAFLESQKFGDANDIFQRVLSSLPDDFVSHVGMSIIREDESNLNEAIWHMERAFEIQPSNNAIQGELRRLYGRRDGIEPPKVNLNRSALARMYLKGNLHSQAIAEIRMALAEDPQRPDLEVLLARAYYETQQIPEAKETANQLFVKLPYCYEAILILWQISQIEGREKEAERFLAKLAELNPYAAHLSKEISSLELVPDTAVILEKYEGSPESVAKTLSEQPDWAASLGVQITSEEEHLDSSLPDWITDQTPTEAPPFELSEETPSGIIYESLETTTEDLSELEIPDWMREAGWEESKTEEETLPEVNEVSHFIEESEPDELAAGEIPEWLKDISPIDEAEVPSSIPPALAETISLPKETPPAEGDSIAAWLAGLETEAEAPEVAAEISIPEAEELPDWVNELNNKSHLTAEIQPAEPSWIEVESSETYSTETPLPVPETPETSSMQLPASNEELPAWLLEEEASPQAEQLPDWLLSSLEEEDEEIPSQLPEVPITEEDTKPVIVHPTPETSLEQPSSFEQFPPSMSEDEAFAWLENLAAKQGAEEALLLSPEQRKEEPPEWIREYLEAQPELALEESPSAVVESIPEEPPAPTEEAAEWLGASRETSLSLSDKPQTEEFPEWLRVELEKEQVSETPTSAIDKSEVPEWVASMTEEVTQEWIQEYPSEPVEEITEGESRVLPSKEADVLISTPAQVEMETMIPEISEITTESLPEGILEEQELDIGLIPKEHAEEAQIAIETKPVPQYEPISQEKAPEMVEPTSPPIEEARHALSSGEIDLALVKYQTLIHQRSELDQVIKDLSDALYHHPMEVKMWMLLGDAYLRKDLLSEALDAYNKAEELLR